MERESLPETHLTEAQETALRGLCERYGVDYAAEHYGPDTDLPDGWVSGWIGGPHHANPAYIQPAEPAGKPTVYVGCSPEGEVHS